MKEFEGKEVYLRPTGNNTRRGNTDILKVKIVKVARVYIYFVRDGFRHESKCRFNGNVFEDGCNSGYVMYPTMEALEDYYEAHKLGRSITDKYRYQTDYAKVELSKLRQIAELLGISKENDDESFRLDGS